MCATDEYKATMRAVEEQCSFVNGEWAVRPEVELRAVDAEMDAVNFESLLMEMRELKVPTRAPIVPRTTP